MFKNSVDIKYLLKHSTFMSWVQMNQKHMAVVASKWNAYGEKTKEESPGQNSCKCSLQIFKVGVVFSWY